MMMKMTAHKASARTKGTDRVWNEDKIKYSAKIT